MADRRSGILDASLRYWRWLGVTLQDWANQIFGPKRRRSVFVFGGCFAWVFIVTAYVFAVFTVATILLGVVAALTIVGALLSLIGGMDQLRLNLAGTRRSARP